jgi:DMSO/TMAO reductase YedYZ heme-binding membrane subunit
MMLAELTPMFPWYLARSAGIVAWAIVTASIVWGLALSSRLIRRKGVPAWLLDLHRFLGVLSVVFTAVHVLGLYFDKAVKFGPNEIFVPMASTWKPMAVTFGVIGMYLILAIELTSLFMRKLPRKVWHAVHLTSFPLFGVATLHGLQAGSDTANLLVQWGALTGGMLVAFLVMFRVMSNEKRDRRKARKAGATIEIAVEDVDAAIHEQQAPADDRAAKIAAAKAAAAAAKAAASRPAPMPELSPLGTPISAPSSMPALTGSSAFAADAGEFALRPPSLSERLDPRALPAPFARSSKP